MQLSGDAALATAVEASDRILVHKFEVDWNRNGLYNHALSDLSTVVKSIDVQRDVNGSLPAETTMVEGYMAGQMTVTLGGKRPQDTDPIAKILSPWNLGGSLFGDGRLVVGVRASIGHRVASGVETLVPQFTGVVSNFRVESRSASVTFTCTDPADKLRAPIDLPVWALDGGTYGKPRKDWRCNSQWAIDYVLRKNGVYMSPPAHAKAIWAATGHGGMVPEVGHMHFTDAGLSPGNRGSEDPVYYPGRPGWGLAYGGDRQGAPTLYSRGRPGFSVRPGNSITVQAQMDLSKRNSVYWSTTGVFLVWAAGASSIGGFGTNTNSIRFSVTPAGQILLSFRNNGSEYVTAFSTALLSLAGYVDFWVRIDCGTPLSASSVTFCTGETKALNLSGTSLDDTNVWPFPSVTWGAPWPMHDLQIVNSTGLAAGTDRYDVGTWVPQADLDAGLLNMSGLPIRRGEDSWALIKEIVAAEYGLAGFNEAGRFFFTNRDTARRNNLTIEKTVTSDKLVTDMSLSERTGSVRNVTSTKVTPRVQRPWDNFDGLGFNPWKPVFKLVTSADMVCGPGSSAHYLTLDEPAWIEETIVGQVTQVPTADWPPGSTNAYPTGYHQSAFTAVKQNNIVVEQAGVLVSITSLPPEYGYDKVLVQVFNPGIDPVIFATTDGEAAFWIMGREYTQDADTNLEVRRASSITKYGPRSLELPDSNWLQGEMAVSSVMRSLLKDLRAPVPTVDNLAIVGDCRLQLLDTLQIQDLGILGGPMLASISGIQRTLVIDQTGAKLTDRLTVRPFAAPGKWILGHTEWSILGQTTKL